MNLHLVACVTKAPFTRPKIFGTARMKKVRVPNNWFGTDRFSRVKDFGPSVQDQNFTRARTMSRGSPSTDPENLAQLGKSVQCKRLAVPS